MSLDQPTLCHYCDRPAVAYCDFTEYEPGPFRGRVRTCDRAICAEHARRVGHVCTRPRSKSDTIDHCRVHEEASP